MNRSRSRHGDQEQPNEISEKLDAMLSLQSATNERLERIESKIDDSRRFAKSVANTEISLELQQMADFSELTAKVAKLSGRVASTNAFVKGLQDKIVELGNGMNDEADQAAVHAVAEEIGALVDALPAAIEANPNPSEPPADPSLGGT